MFFIAGVADVMEIWEDFYIDFVAYRIHGVSVTTNTKRYDYLGSGDGYDRVSDVVENGGRFASKILTHNRMH